MGKGQISETYLFMDDDASEQEEVTHSLISSAIGRHEIDKKKDCLIKWFEQKGNIVKQTNYE